MDPEQRMGILRVLGQVHIADDVDEGDIKGKEQFKVCKPAAQHQLFTGQNVNLHKRNFSVKYTRITDCIFKKYCKMLCPSTMWYTTGITASFAFVALFLFSQHLDMEEDTKSLKGQLLSVCSSLEKLPSLDPLLGVWQGVRVRMFMHYQLSARAYFTFLKLSGTQSVYSPGNNRPCLSFCLDRYTTCAL